MAPKHTPICDFTFHAPDFLLPNFGANPHNLSKIQENIPLRFSNIQGLNGTLIVFICNHCPYVKSIISDLVEIFTLLRAEDIGICAIMPNDIKSHPEDAPDKMQEFALQHSFTFPYLYDAKQQTAHDYHAVCTPDFFGFNQAGQLNYRGRLYDPKNKPSLLTQAELYLAMLQISKTQTGPVTQNASMGCSIKWHNTC